MYDDAKECTFKPTLHARAGGKGKRGGEEKKDDDEAKRDKDDAAKDRDAFGFLDRQVTCPLAISLVLLVPLLIQPFTICVWQEAMEREKQRKLEETMGREAYDVLKKRGMTKVPRSHPNTLSLTLTCRAALSHCSFVTCVVCRAARSAGRSKATTRC